MAYSGVTLVSFLFVAASFQLVPVYSGTILVHSDSFHRVPVYSVPFHSVPVFSNARNQHTLTDYLTKRPTILFHTK